MQQEYGASLTIVGLLALIVIGLELNTMSEFALVETTMPPSAASPPNAPSATAEPSPTGLPTATVTVAAPAPSAVLSRVACAQRSFCLRVSPGQ